MRMPGSQALEAFRKALLEIKCLSRVSPTKAGGRPRDPDATRAVARASIVLLASHFERYFYAVNEEAIAILSLSISDGTVLPEDFRLLHSKSAIDDLAIVAWEKRDKKLEQFIQLDGWLWSPSLDGYLEATRMLAWMKTPSPENLIRYYRYWGIENIFSSITRYDRTRSSMIFRIRALVDKRNNIAHGDITEQSTPEDIGLYAKAAKDFCERADRAFAKRIAHMLNSDRPW